MAQLKSGSTVGGNAILTTASSVGFPSGTVMVFHQASAPTGWTKSTTHNDKALRVVSGSGGGSGGSHSVSSPPSTAHTHTGPSHTHSTPNHTHSHTLSGGSHTLSTAQMPSHSHSVVAKGSSYGGSGQAPGIYNTSYHTCPYWTATNVSTTSAGSGSSHSHSLSGSISSSGGSTTGSGGTGTTSSSGPTAFAPRYVDVIIATKA